MNRKILFVDDDENILSAYYRTFKGRYDVNLAANGIQALQVMRDQGPFAVVVADLAMPKMNGIDFLCKAQELSPQTIRIMLTGHAGVSVAIEGVNKGQLFRFLAKPCDCEVLASALDAGIRQYALVASERELLEQTFGSSLRILVELLAVEDPRRFDFLQRLADHALRVARHMKLQDEWTVQLAAMLSRVGLLRIPSDVQEKLKEGLPLLVHERDLVERIPELGAQVLENIPRLEGVIQIIRYQAKRFDGSGFPCDTVKGEQIPLGARILHPLMDFLKLEADLSSRVVAMHGLRQNAHSYDPKVLDAIEQVMGIQASA